MTKILAFSGSTRKESYNSRLLTIAIKGCEQAGAEVNRVDLKDYPMPIFNQDDEAEFGMPEHAARFKALMVESDGILLASPEYNGGFSPLLKNTIDWASRSQSDGEPPLVAFRDKWAILMSASPGSLGGQRGLTMLRMLLSGIGMIVLPNQLTVANAGKAFDYNGRLINDKQREQAMNLGKVLAQMASKSR